MIIDAHIHVGRHFGPGLLAELRAAADRLGVVRLLASALGRNGFVEYPTVDDLRSANEQTAEAVSSDPVFAGMVYCSGEHPRESLDEMRRHIADGPFVGVKLWISRRATDPGCDAIFDYAAELGVPVLQHAWWKTVGAFDHESTPADLVAAAQRHPGTTFQMAHLYGSSERGVDDIAPCPNIVVDTSGSDAEAGLLPYAVSVLGPERIVYGSDTPGRGMAAQLAKITSAHLSPEVEELLLAGNARRLYGRLGLGPVDRVEFREVVSIRPTIPDSTRRWRGDSAPDRGESGVAGAVPRQRGRGTIPYVDCSAFLGPWPFRTVPLTDAASLERGLRAVGVTHAWVSPTAAITEPSPAAANEAMVAEISGNDFFSPVPVLNPVRRGLVELDRWTQGQSRVGAIRLLPGAHAYDLAQAGDLVAAAADRDVAVVVQVRVRDPRLSHPRFVLPEPAAAEVIDLARAHPSARIVVAGVTAAEIRVLLASGQRLWCDLSHADGQDVVRHLVTEYGSARLLSGTHAPILVPEAMSARLADAIIADTDLHAIARANAAAAGLGRSERNS